MFANRRTRTKGKRDKQRWVAAFRFSSFLSPFSFIPFFRKNTHMYNVQQRQSRRIERTLRKRPLLPFYQDFFVVFPAPTGIHQRVCWPRLRSQETRAQEFDAERKTRALGYCPSFPGVDADCRGAVVEENFVLFLIVHSCRGSPHSPFAFRCQGVC